MNGKPLDGKMGKKRGQHPDEGGHHQGYVPHGVGKDRKQRE